MNFAIVRLGKDSVKEIRQLDGLHASPDKPITFSLRCAQVPHELSSGDIAFLCLGSDNNKGVTTEWSRGLRAVGSVIEKLGGPGYNDQWELLIQVRIVLPESVSARDLLARAPEAYYWCSAIPVLGVDTHSNQTVQLIRGDEPLQSVEALVYAITLIAPKFADDVRKSYPHLAPYLNYSHRSPLISLKSEVKPDGLDSSENLPGIAVGFHEQAVGAGLRLVFRDVCSIVASLLSKRFLIASGLSGSGKTKSLVCFSRWMANCSLEGAQQKVSSGDQMREGTWSRDELIVALDLYRRYRDKPPEGMLHQVAHQIGRSVSSVSLRLANFLSIESNGSHGLNNGGRGAKRVFEEFQGKWDLLDDEANRAIVALTNNVVFEGSAVINLDFDSQSLIVPVGADWTGNENILGYPDGLDPCAYRSTSALELILRASRNPKVPHFLILDEMNLSHVERYFADFLSVIESEGAIPLYEGPPRKAGDREIPNRLRLPKNLFVIGTVNVDETTYMFSPKVLDRANVIEFRMSDGEMEEFLKSPTRPDLSALAGKGAHYGKAFVDAATDEKVTVPANVKEEFETEMMRFFNILAGHHAEFGYRTAHEAARFIYFYKVLGGYEEEDTAWFREAMDCVIFQKLLPKLHGSQSKLKPLLLELWRAVMHREADGESNPNTEPKADLHTAAFYPISAEKIYRMWKLLHTNGFASFAEA